MLTDPENCLESDDEYIQLRSAYRHRVNILTRFLLTIIIETLLLVPTSILFLVNGNNGLQIFLTFAFTFFFAGMLHVGTKAQRFDLSTAVTKNNTNALVHRQEISAATAAYCAVLVVFLGNVV